MDRENRNSDKNEQFTHQRIIRDETKKLGVATPDGSDKWFRISLIIGLGFAIPIWLGFSVIILNGVLWHGGPVGIVMVGCLLIPAFFWVRFLTHVPIVYTKMLYSRLRSTELEEGVFQRGDIVGFLYPDGGIVNISAQIEESKLMQVHPRIEPPKEMTEEEQIQYNYGIFGDANRVCNYMNLPTSRVYSVLEPIMALEKAGMQEQEPEEGYFE